jgi:hypothetical protein
MPDVAFLSRNIRILILLLGFASSLTGTLGSLLFIDNLDTQLKRATDRQIRGRNRPRYGTFVSGIS